MERRAERQVEGTTEKALGLLREFCAASEKDMIHSKS